MNQVRSKGKCGSCWAFADLSKIEGNFNINFGS